MYGEWGRPVSGAEFEREARNEAAANRATEENEGVGPIPPHPDEAPDDRRTLTVVGLMSQQDYDWLYSGGAHECGPLCDLVTQLQTRMEEEDRIPVQPPALSVEGVVGCWKARFVVDTVPARGRTFMIHALCGDVQAEIDEALRELEYVPTERLVVRRRSRQPYATAVVYRPRPRPGVVPNGFMLLEDEAGRAFGDVSDLVERLVSGEYRLVEAVTMEVLPSGIVSVLLSPAQQLP